MKIVKNILCLFGISFMSACGVPPMVAVSPTPPIPASPEIVDYETATLATLQEVDDFPLYTMHYYGEYESRRALNLIPVRTAESTPDWACSLFTVLLDDENQLFARNFDWRFSPALLVFTEPPDGYASVSMVDIEYLGFEGQSVFNLKELPLQEREGLLDAPLLPFDGMNEHGLAIGMAAVPDSYVPSDPDKETIGSIGIIREVLDHARTVDEAIGIMNRYNINFGGGPSIHYLLADSNKDSALVEFYDGKMRIIESDQPWHSTTNFLQSSVDHPKDGNCWRYNKINTQLQETQGRLDSVSAMELLSKVAQENTQWSVVYHMARREVSISMGGDFTQVYTFKTSDYLDNPSK